MDTTNMSLFIKRAEERQTEEFIKKAFASHQIGKVSNLTFIKKNNVQGQTYHGVIVNFEHWNNNPLVQKLLNEMASSPDKTTKFYFDRNRYWIINVHQHPVMAVKKEKEEEEEPKEVLVDPSLSDKEKIRLLEAKVNSMSAQFYQLQTQREKMERTMMECENRRTYHHLLNVDLHSQLTQEQHNHRWTHIAMTETIQELFQENQQYKSAWKEVSDTLAMRNQQYKELQQELLEANSIVEYYNNDNV